MADDRAFCLTMRILPVTPATIAEAGALLRDGGVIVYPTDTAYALGGRWDLPAVHQRILSIKKRTDDKFTLICANRIQVDQFFPLDRVTQALARRHWPGPLSIVVSDTAAVRVPDNDIARQLAALAGAPLIATSANISGQATLYSAASVTEKFARVSEQPDLILDAGRLPMVPPSTIIRIDDGRVTVIRSGPVTIERV